MPVTRSSTFVAVACAGVAGACVAAVVCTLMGGETATVSMAALVAMVSALPGLLPVAAKSGVVKIAKWGTLAFAGTLLQPISAGVVGFIVDSSSDLPRMMYWMSCLAGAMVVLTMQVGWTIRVLSRGQRLWDGSRTLSEAA